MTSIDLQPHRQVIIVGGGPTGLALAVELGTRAISCLLIERNDRSGWVPRAKTTHTRTREHFRRWGIADKLAEASPFGVDYPNTIAFVTRLAGHSIARFPNAFNASPERDERYAEHAQWIPQYKLEKVLRDRAKSLPGVTIAFGQELVSFMQNESTVRATIRDTATGKDVIIEAEYLVGADGSRSTVRELIGAKMNGKYGLSRAYNTIFRAPGLVDAHPHGKAVMIWQINKDVPSVIGPMDQGDLWYFTPAGVPEGVTYTNDEMLALIRKATGIDLPYEILSSDEWVASVLIADRYQQGRVFLSGDACHLHPPFGGYGMNMGIGDSVDLGWKIAANLQGWGARALVDSYVEERRPIHEFVIEEARKNHSLLPPQLVREHMEEDNEQGASAREEIAREIAASKPNEFYSLGVMLGYRYQNSSFIAYEINDDWTWDRSYSPSAAPGCRAPHHWLEDGRSLYDLFGNGFTLLVLAETNGSDIAEACADAEALGVPLEVVIYDNPELAKCYRASRALIRPDQHVAWRGDHWSSGLLSQVTGLNGGRH